MQGFTLVELSIVIVVIGLLIGGVLVGQSLIEASKIQGLVKEQQSYVIAVRNFKHKFKYIPGDAPNSIFPVAGAGAPDSDGYIDNYIEEGRFWVHLSLGGFLKEQYTYTGTSATLRVSVPESKYVKNLAYRMLTGSGWSNTYPLAFILRGANLTDMSTASQYAHVPSIMSMAFDQKIDDGLPLDGDVTGYWGNFNTGEDGIYVAENRCIRSGQSVYNKSDTAKCMITINFDSQIR